MKNKTILSFFICFCVFKSYTQCSYPTSFSSLSINRLKVSITNDGSIFSKKDGSTGGVEYPKRTQHEIQAKELAKTPIFGGGIILSGYENGSLKVSSSVAATKNNYDFVAGPINSKTGKIAENSCNSFDKIWSVSKIQVDNFRNKVQNTAIFPLDISKIEKNILEWPAIGNTRMDNGAVIEESLAPFVDYNQNNIYDPEYGDYPLIDGDIANFWVMNDLGSKHNTFNSNRSLGVEIQMMAFQYIDTPLNSSIIYKSKIVKKTTGDINDFIVSLYVDPDLGNYNDDYLGCDSDKYYAFAYNGDNYDETTEVGGYVNSPPILTTVFLSQPMGAFLSFPYTSGVQGFKPSTDTVCRYYMEGKTGKGTSFTFGNNGLYGTQPTRFLFSGNPAKKEEWSMLSAKIAPKDSKYLQSTKAIDLKYNTSANFDFMLNVFPIEDYSVNFDKNNKTMKIEAIKNELNIKNDKCVNIPQLVIESDSVNTNLGSATVSKVINGVAPFHYKWNTGEEVQQIVSKNPGIYNVTITDAKNCQIKATMAIKRDLIIFTTNSVDNIISTDNISINIINDEIILNNFQSNFIDKISIIDLSGKEVAILDINSIINSNKISISQLLPGVYFLSLTDKNSIQNLKFLKS